MEVQTNDFTGQTIGQSLADSPRQVGAVAACDQVPALATKLAAEIQCISEGTMAATEMVHVRIDKRVKTQAVKALSAMGLSVSDAVRVLLMRVAAEKALPFDLKVPNAGTTAAMKEARAGGLASFDTVSDLMADLNAED